MYKLVYTYNDDEALLYYTKRLVKIASTLQYAS